ncbi:MAG: ATP-binding cassette domain-containing protein [Flavobacteriales bacterium]|nr:ATP-binding cassette domain-containing protein [Flavobacteriales bacterium]
MIQLKNIDKKFKDKLALDNLSLEVKSGEIYGLLGANGAGKSTTLNLLLGFLTADRGEINMVDINDSSIIKQDRIGYIPENVNLYPYLTGVENLDYFSKLAGLKFTLEELARFLLECGLEEEAFNKSISEYSKGMRQKVGIAIAYAKNAKIYLLDEPASGLDPLSSNELSILLKKMSERGATILMASHDIFRVRETCHKIGILKNGSLVKEMFSKDVSSRELESLYLDYMKN